MDEIVRCSRRYVLCGEYHADELEEVRYRGEEGALFGTTTGASTRSATPSSSWSRRASSRAAEGVWDDVTFWVFEKA